MYTKSSLIGATSMDLLDALDQTFRHAQGVIDNVRADQYDNPTPCEEWVVRDLLGHTIAVVAGLGPAASGAAPAKFALGPDPAAQFRDAAAAALAGWRTPGVMDKVVDVAVGPMPGRVLAGINLLDTATHTWDIATATGQPAELPSAVAEAALEVSRATISADIRPGRFGPEVPAAPDAGPTEQLVAFLGRTP
jgi:uncharacterized protein (TIGR03086 family)